MRADRLLSILLLLQSKGRMTAHELALQLEVSERTIYRDLEALGIAGVPVYTERGPGGGCELINGYQTKLTGLTEFEVRALFLAHLTAPLADLGLDQALDQAMLKLSAALPAPSRDNAEQMRQRVHFDASWWYHDEMSINYLQTIQEAVWQDRKLELLYLEDDGTQSELLIEAYGLVAKAGVWYLVGSGTCQLRVLRVSRIQRAIALVECFQRPTHFDLASFWSEYCIQVEANPGQYAAPLRLAPEDAPRIHETLSSWGYRLVENKEYLSVQEESVQKQPARNSFPHPRRFRQQKKETRTSVHTRPFVPGKEKKTYTPYKKKPFAQKKNGLPRPIKKRAFSAQQKKALCQPIKKTNFIILTPLPLCA
jgi:predicted DNA-binding transcriptional regulator YafY